MNRETLTEQIDLVSGALEGLDALTALHLHFGEICPEDLEILLSLYGQLATRYQSMVPYLHQIMDEPVALLKTV